MEVVNYISLDDITGFLLEERVSKEGGNDDKVFNEQGTKPISFDTDRDHFLGEFLLKTTSRLISLFREVYFPAGTNERIDGNFQEERNMHEY